MARTGTALLLSLGLGLMVGLAWTLGWLELAEAPLRDLRFRMRHHLQGTQPVDERLVLVLVDDESLVKIARPYSLWSPQRVRVFRALTEAGARVVAPDLLWQVDPDSVKDDEHLKGVYQELSEAEVNLALLLLQTPLVLGGQLEQLEGRTDVVHRPRPQLFAIVGAEMPLLNLSPDDDGVIRTLPLAVQVNEGDGFYWMPSFALRIAQLAQGLEFDLARDLQPQESPTAATFGEVTVPLVRGRMDINYAGPAGSIPSVSFADVLAHSENPEFMERFRGAVVLLGNSDPRFLDVHRSPFSQAGNPDMPGTEIHAQAVNTLLTGRFLRVAPPAVNWLAILGLALFTGWLAFTRSPRTGLLAALLALVLWCGLAFWLFLNRGVWLGMTGPLLVVPVTYSGIYIFRYLVIERERAALRNLFSRYVPRQVADAVAQDPKVAQLGGASRRVTVLFSDINNFTPTCEKLAPQEVIELLNEYFREMNRIIYQHDGTLRQFVGDEIMVIYGAPLPMEDHTAKALQTAVDMTRRLEELKRAASGGPDFYDVKIGIHTGDVVVGNVGSEERMEYTAVGDDVNLASRIMGLNKSLGTSVLISEVTLLELEKPPPGVKFRTVGRQNFKGREQSMELFEVCVDEDDEVGSPAVDPGPSA